MKKFKKFIAMCLAATMMLSLGSIGVFADDNYEADAIYVSAEDIQNSENVIEPRITYNMPTQYLDISTVHYEYFNGVTNSTGTGYSDFYFSPGSGLAVSLRSRGDVYTTEPNSSFRVELINRSSGGGSVRFFL